MLFCLNPTFKKNEIRQSITTTHWKLTFTPPFPWNCSYQWHQLLPNYESQALSSGLQIVDILKILLNLAFVISCLLGYIFSEYWSAITCHCLDIGIPRGLHQFPHFLFSFCNFSQFYIFHNYFHMQWTQILTSWTLFTMCNNSWGS